MKLLERYNFKRVIGVPLVWEGDAIGAINVHSQDGIREFADQDLQLLRIFADFATIAIVKADNHSRISDELRYFRFVHRLYDIHESGRELDDILTIVLAAVRELLVESDIVIFVENMFTNALEHISNMSLSGEQVAALQSIVLETQKVGVSEEWDLRDGMFPWNTVVSIPLMCNRRTVGALLLGGHFDADKRVDGLDVLQSAVDQIAIAIDRYLLRMQQDIKSQELLFTIRNISTAAKRISSQTGDLITCSRSIVEAFQRLIGSGKVVLFAHNNGNISHICDEPSPAGQEVLDALKNMLDLLIGELIDGRKMLDISGRYEAIESISGMNTAKLYVCPLCVSRDVLGIIVLAPENELAGATRNAVKVLADIAGIALNNATMFSHNTEALRESTTAQEEMGLKMRIYDGLVECILENRPLLDIVDYIRPHITGSVKIQDVAGNVLVNSAADPVDSVGGMKEVLFPVTGGGRRLGKVTVVVEGTCSLSPYQEDIIICFAKIVGIHLWNKWTAIEAEQRLRGELFEGILSGSLDNAEAIYRAGYLGLNAESAFRVLVLEFSDGDKGLSYEDEKDIRETILCWPLYSDRVVFIGRRQEIVIIVRGQDGEVLSKVRRDIQKLSRRCFCGLSGEKVNIVHTREAYREAKQAAMIGKISARPCEVMEADAMGLIPWIFHDNNIPMMRELMWSTIGKLIESPGNHILIKTLETYLDSGCNAAETANKLFIHANTLKYRINKIKELTGVDTNNFMNRVSLYLACKCFRLVGEDISVVREAGEMN